MGDSNEIMARNFDISDETIHKLAATILLSSYESEFILTQGKYAYKVKGGNGGQLYYKKAPSDKWVLIANRCFYGLYIAVRYRKPIWLRPMYECLFSKMHFTSVDFQDYSIKLTGSNGEILSSRRFRLSPPQALDKVMTDKFGYSKERVQSLKTEMGLD